MEEAAWLVRLRAGEVEAFDELVRQHQDALFNLAYRLVGNEEEAKDVTQEAFVRAYRALPRFRGDASVKTWLYTILRNVAKNKLREWSRHRRWATDSLDAPLPGASEEGPAPSRELPDGGANALERLEGREREALVHRALQELDASFRTVVVLFDFEGMSYEEIGRVCECPVGTVRSRLHRGRALLRARLQELLV